MGDSACLVHAFSHTSAIPTQTTQGNLMHGLGESVSFGRFMSESLAWEKWSTFSHNRYVEEAERYSQPGSVAQKKAFFEAHYKRIAAKKAAALLEQANNAITTTTEPPETETETESVIHCAAISDSQPLTSNSSHLAQAFHEQQPPQHDEEPQVQSEDSKPDFMATVNPNPEHIFAPAATDVQALAEPQAPLEIPSVKFPEILKNQEIVSGSDEPQIEKPLLQQNFSSDQDAPSVQSKKKSAFSSLTSSVYRKKSKVPSSPAKSITPRIKKESNANSATTPITNNKKHALDFMEKKRSTPKPVNSFVNSTPVKQISYLLTPARERATRKMDNSRIAPDSCKRSHNGTTPLGIQNMKPSAEMSKDASAATPRSANTRTKTAGDGNKTSGPKWHILSAVCSKSLTACRNKLQSPTLSTPFILRTEERAARRKQKLEEKFNSEDIEKVQLQTSLKEKAELELRKLRQSFCFKARPLPEFYKEREAQNNQIKKNPVTKSQSPRLGRKPSSRTMQGTVSLPSSNTLNKNGMKKFAPASSLPEMINRENASPNIQH